MLTEKRFQVTTLVLLVVIAVHVRKVYEVQNPQCPQLLSWFGIPKEA